MIKQLDAGHSEALTIDLYHGNASLLAESLEVIQQTATVILGALELPMQETAEDAAAEPELAEVAA